MRSKRVLAILATLALAVVATAQLMELIKIIGIGAAVQKFGPEMNKALNKLTNHKDTDKQWTKVVPILSVGIGGGSSAIGAAQVTGPKSQVEKVNAVASPELNFLGEVRLRALIPVSNKELKSIRSVQGVGVSGIVDLKL
ncbi:MAG: hypothetical protein HONBIEJF_02429 [Fimbriimonadaceae bacterium]|nr:hypothetical protein [Fimbriimonadaceae bacterium]